MCLSFITEFTRSLVLCVCFFFIVVCPFVLFLLAIVLSVLLRFTGSDYPFGIFKLFLNYIKIYKCISVRLKYSRCLFYFLFHLQKLILELIFSVECLFVKLKCSWILKCCPGDTIPAVYAYTVSLTTYYISAIKHPLQFYVNHILINNKLIYVYNELCSEFILLF